MHAATWWDTTYLCECCSLSLAAFDPALCAHLNLTCYRMVAQKAAQKHQRAVEEAAERAEAEKAGLRQQSAEACAAAVAASEERLHAAYSTK